ncbi:MAG: hypothetical protein LBL51_03450 [Synergistaceae bacterium]|nr:hypothetical protein [Synergistaceae bacterium]
MIAKVLEKELFELIAKVLETVMLVCFGAAWPLSILKSWRSRTARGKSLCFLINILVGYAAGITKVILTDGWGGFLLIPYILNFLMVFLDMTMYFRNRKLDLIEESLARQP